jgi:hypothetical protein
LVGNFDNFIDQTDKTNQPDQINQKLMISTVPAEIIEKKILLIRGQKVMLDADLAELYGVATKVLNQAVKRNSKRFPPDFMFQLTLYEKNELVTVCDRFKNLKHSSVLPRAFTEQGVAMLSTVLNSERAIEVNILIMRAFVILREMIASHKDLARRLDELEQKYDGQFKIVFEAIRQLMAPPVKPKRKIGFELKERQTRYFIKGARIKRKRLLQITGY